jgi:hypothetical protein
MERYACSILSSRTWLHRHGNAEHERTELTQHLRMKRQHGIYPSSDHRRWTIANGDGPGYHLTKPYTDADLLRQVHGALQGVAMREPAVAG